MTAEWKAGAETTGTRPGTGTRRPTCGYQSWTIGREAVLVSEEEIARAVGFLHREAGLRVEPWTVVTGALAE